MAKARVAGLPEPRTRSEHSLEEVIGRRRSIRRFTSDDLTPEELGQLLWAAQGVTDDTGRRTAPSAGALGPLELYVVTRDGVFQYVKDGHRLESRGKGDRRRALGSAAADQTFVGDAPVVIVVTGILARTAWKFGGDRAWRYVNLEAGHAAQNLMLQATALGLGGVTVGAFDDNAVMDLLGLPADHRPLYLLPVGHPAEEDGS
jgi:SagB-type dehydrogenase family enzyme